MIKIDVTELESVCVEWKDAHSLTDSWTDIIGEAEPRIIYTNGWLLEGVKEGHLVIALSADSSGKIDMTIAIPTECVISYESQGKIHRPKKKYPWWCED
jgi:hypothetical protein